MARRRTTEVDRHDGALKRRWSAERAGPAPEFEPGPREYPPGHRERQRGCSRVFVVSVPFGGGHRAVSEALGEGLRLEGKGCLAVDVVDGLDAVSKRVSLARVGALGYAWLTRRRVRPLYRLLYGLADRRPVLVGTFWHILFRKRVRKWLLAEQPDIVVSTFPFVSYLLGEAIAAAGMRTRLVTVVTDAGHVNRSWFSGRADAVLVTDEDAHRHASRCLRTASLHRGPLPLRSGFSRMSAVSRVEARQSLQLGDELAVLIWGGGLGIAQGMLEMADAFRAFDDNVVPIFVTGTNHRLAARLGRRVPTKAKILSYVEDVPMLLSAVDVVMGKPGWVSLVEARAAGLHTICFDALPGQEAENLRVAVRAGSASWQPDKVMAVQAIRAAPPRSRPHGIAFPSRLTPDAISAIFGPEPGLMAR